MISKESDTKLEGGFQTMNKGRQQTDLEQGVCDETDDPIQCWVRGQHPDNVTRVCCEGEQQAEHEKLLGSR